MDIEITFQQVIEGAAWMENKNGMSTISGLRIWTAYDRVYIEGRNRAGQILRGGLCVPMADFYRLCEMVVAHCEEWTQPPIS